MSDFLSTVVNDVTSGATVTIETSLTPPMTVGLNTGDAPDTHSLWDSFLRPRVTLEKGGQVLASYTPHGDPGATRTAVYLAALALIIIFIGYRVNR